MELALVCSWCVTGEYCYDRPSYHFAVCQTAHTDRTQFCARSYQCVYCVHIASSLLKILCVICTKCDPIHNAKCACILVHTSVHQVCLLKIHLASENVLFVQCLQEKKNKKNLVLDFWTANRVPTIHNFLSVHIYYLLWLGALKIIFQLSAITGK